MSQEDQQRYTNISVNELENSQVEITGEMPTEIFKEYIDSTIQKFKENTEIDGFRKGKAPDKVVEEHVGEEKILNEAAQDALSEIYPEILKENQIDAIGRPNVSVTKLAKDNPLGFTFKSAVAPNFELPDYKNLAKDTLIADGEEKTEVTDKEVDDVIYEIRKSRAPQNTQKPTNEEGQNQENEIENNILEENLPELDDEFVKTLGNFQSVDDLKQQIKQNLTHEKELRAKDKKRLKIIEQIIQNTQISIPETMIESELDKMISQVKNDVEENSGYTFDEYLKHIQKTEENIREDWRGEAEKRAKIQLTLNKIAERESLSPSEEEVKTNLDAVLEKYPNADKEAARVYVETVLANEKVYNLLESQSEANENKEKDQASQPQQEEESQ